MTLSGNRPIVPVPGYQRIHSDGQEAGLELTDGQLLPVSSVDEGRLRYNRSTGLFETSSSADPYVSLLTTESLSVPTLAALAALPSAGLGDGFRVYVYDQNIEDVYVLDRVGAHTPDGLMVIAAADGGFWVARIEGRWDDVQGSVSQGTAVGALTYENFRGTAFKMNFFRHDQADELSKSYQMPHRWRYSTDVTPHLHVVPMSAPVSAQQVLFDGYYHWVASGNGPIPDVGGWTAFSTLVTINPADEFFHRYAPLGDWTPPPEARESTMLLIYLRRNGTDPNDTYDTNKTGGTIQANLGLLSADIHFRARKHGSENQAPSP